jgi:hypothetical protein
MDNYKQHTVIEGQRWDSIALEYYGSASMMNKLIQDNPDVPLYDNIPGGVVLNIEIIATSDVAPDANMLPPWKR